MIAYLTGKVVRGETGGMILDVGGVGYSLAVPSKVESREGQEVKFFIYEHIREDCYDLYGFLEYDELILFKQLISVNGVGPKVGMLIMSASEPDRVKSAILSDDQVFFQSIPGIGKKVAARIILDLKGKITGFEVGGIPKAVADSDEVCEALSSLGYKKHEVLKILSKIPSNITGAEEKIHWCLKNAK